MILKPIFFACAALIVSQTAPAQDSYSPPSGTTQSTTTSSGTKSTQTTRRRASVSTMAGHMLNKVDQARQEIAKNNRAAALKDVNDAEAMASQISSAGTNRGQMVPVFAELEEVSVVGPAVSAQQQSAAAAQQYADRPSPAPSGMPAETVRDVTGDYTAISLDMGSAKDHLDAAKTALQNNNLQAADAALSAIQNSIVLTSVATDLPLVRARQNLQLARAMVKEGHAADAGPSLKAASDALGEYENTPGVSHAAEARSIQQQIDSDTSSITSNSSDAASRIEGWSTQIRSWSPQQQRQPNPY